MRKSHVFKYFLSILFGMISFSLIFVGGYFTNDANVERIADYTARVATEQSEGQLFSLTVGASDKKTSLLPVDHELFNLYGIFKQRKITFASTINADKKDHTIYLDGNTDCNLSFLYVGSVGTDKYKGTEKYEGQENYGWKHRQFPVELMFEDSGKKAREFADDTNPKYPCYISETQAIRLLNKNYGFDDSSHKYSKDDYEKLLYKTIKVQIDKTQNFDFAILNIYSEKNYYCKGLSYTMGNFLVCSYWLPMNLRLEQRSTYFMSEYSYQNRYFMNYINETYGGNNYNVDVNSFNISGHYDKNFIISFHSKEEYKSFLPAILISLAAFTLLANVGFIYFAKIKWMLPLLLLSSFIPYYLFKIIYKIGKDVRWFSSFSCRLFFFVFLFVLLLICLYWLFEACIKARKTNLKYYEVNI